MSTSLSWDEFQAAAETVDGVRKTLGAVLAIGDADAAVPGSITTDGVKVNALPSGYRYLGLLAPEGVNLAAEINFDEVEALGHFSAVRRDPASTGAAAETGVHSAGCRAPCARPRRCCVPRAASPR